MAKTRAATPVAPSKAAEELTKRYVEALRRLQGTVQKRVESAAREIAAAPEQVQTKARNDAIELVNGYIEGLRGSLGQSDASQRLELAIRSYVLGLQRVGEDVQKDVVDAVRDYALTMREIPAEVRQGIEDAYADYRAGLQDRLGQMDLDDISPEELLALGQSMTTVALYTRAALGR